MYRILVILLFFVYSCSSDSKDFRYVVEISSNDPQHILISYYNPNFNTLFDDIIVFNENDIWIYEDYFNGGSLSIEVLSLNYIPGTFIEVSIYVRDELKLYNTGDGQYPIYLNY